MSNQVRGIWKWSEILCQINQEIVKASNNNRNSSEAFHLMCPWLASVLFTVWGIKWSVKKPCIAKVLVPIWEIFLHENNCNYNSYRFSYKVPFILFFSFITNQKQELCFQQCFLVWLQEIFLFFIHSESRTTSKPCRIQ